MNVPTREVHKICRHLSLSGSMLIAAGFLIAGSSMAWADPFWGAIGRSIEGEIVGGVIGGEVGADIGADLGAVHKDSRRFGDTPHSYALENES